LIEGVVDRGSIRDQKAGLAEVIEHERGQRDDEPGQPDRHPAEMAHIRVHRFTTCHRQKGGAENGEADMEILVDQEVEGIEWAQRGKYRRRLDNAVDTEQGEHREPSEHHRSEDLPDESGALLLHHKQPDQDDDGQRHHDRRQ
jgi:hypothetical protein